MHAIGQTAATGAANPPSHPQPRLVRAAHEFEAQMMKELLKPLESASGLSAESDDAEGSAGALGDFAGECLAGALSQRGGFGIADRIVHSLSQKGAAFRSAEVTRNQHQDTSVNNSK